MSNEITYRFGPYADGMSYIYKPNTSQYITIGGKRVKYMPWLLRHVDSITMSVNGTTTTMGIPTKPATMSQVFDTSGPVRTIKISGRRYDWEESISNWDFIFTEANFSTDDMYPSKGEMCYIGLVWLFHPLQILQKGYTFTIVNPDRDNRYPYKPEGYNVSITGLSATFSEVEPGLLEYTITLTERVKTTESTYTPYVVDQ